ncbi:hypothetical protein BBJ28_00025922 [Nothophytophthora sp. Chile5]|nr:hypothetical protein BBJ28_00025922 [Nothophytophthora sp. Chile5]
MSSHLATLGFSAKMPAYKLFSFKYLVLSVNHSNSHWTLIIVTTEPYGMLSVHFYDPLSGRPYKTETELVWTSKLLPFVRIWYSARWSDGDYPFPSEVRDHWIATPKQPDGSSCGIMCLAMAYSYLHGNQGFERDTVTKDVVQVMRLRLLWVILCGSVIHPISPEDEAAIEDTGKELISIFVKKSAKVW